VVGSYAEAQKLAAIWGTPVSDTSIHQCVQELGPPAQKLVMPTPVPAPREAPFDLVLMMDGWLTRERGPDWSAGPRKKDPEPVEWKEIKSAVIYRLEQRAENTSGRGLLLEKHVVATPPDTSPLDFGQAVREEAMRRGLARAKTVYLAMDGAVWLWDLADDRFKAAVKTLDFHHAREHLNTIAESLYGIGTQRAKDWLAEQVQSLRHGDEALVINRLEHLLKSQAQKDKLKHFLLLFQSHCPFLFCLSRNDLQAGQKANCTVRGGWEFSPNSGEFYNAVFGPISRAVHSHSLNSAPHRTLQNHQQLQDARGRWGDRGWVGWERRTSTNWRPIH